MKRTRINQITLLLLPFTLASFIGIANKETAQACHAHGGHSRDLIGCDRSSPKPTRPSVSPSSGSSEHSSNLSALQDDLQRMLAGRAWIKEKTKEYPFRTIFQLRNGSELSIQSSEFGSTDKPYPVFPFFNFELKEREGKRFIVPINGLFLESGISEISYHLDKERERLIIERGSMIVWYGGAKKEIDLRGEYTPWFPTFDR